MSFGVWGSRYDIEIGSELWTYWITND